ncbi:DUF805 domain-containing protein [Thalassotalea agarivorans]|uniref:DUF805 domain-containing protein n=1 Tax=Thalassotalea agarivorans TaxID=349064 RepID=A0A1I0DP71_THASX|nr:hypothetical protein [Thalassotalea agarivorans]SET33678.1 hypothetical protein SAMN05660429_01581 [Thalassotalea agarivorans]
MNPLLSLFCIKGFDNRSRFFTISSCVYVGFIVLTALFPNSTLIPIWILLFALVPLACSTKRRLNDAELNQKWIFAPTVSFFVAGVIIAFAEHHSVYWLLFFPIVLSSVLLTYPSKRNRHYVQGYNGPVDMSAFDHQAKQSKRHASRVEPSLATQSNDTTLLETSFENRLSQADAYLQSKESQQATTNPDFGELVRTKLLGNKNAAFTIIVVAGLIVAGVIITSIAAAVSGDATPTENNESNVEQVVTQVAMIRDNPLAMPDDYTLYFSEHQGLIFHWQGETASNAEYWTLATGLGDEECTELNFQNKEKYRPLTVSVENGINYYAVFSPIDTQPILQSLAFRGRFELCGYKFSLKGSQKALGKNPSYNNFIEY